MAALAAAPATGVKRIAMVALSGQVLLQLCGSLLSEIATRRHRVLAITSHISDDEVQVLQEMGVEHAVFDAELRGIKLLSDWKAIASLKSVLAAWAPHEVMGIGAKAMVYAVLAAKGANVDRIVARIDGLPEHEFDGTAAADEMPAWRYGQAMRAAHAAVFHNRQDVGLLTRLGLLPPALPVTIVPGAGIDSKQHEILPLPPLDRGLVFLMIAPLDQRKGIIEYCEAAAKVHAHSPNAHFLLAGPADGGPFSLLPDDIAEFGTAVEYLGPADDVRELLAQCHVFVFPSYAEGLPQNVLEAMAAGRVLITTNVSGCRDTVDERVNGCIVPARDSEALAVAMESFIKRPDLLPTIARASRAKSERFCDAQMVNRSLLTVLGLE
jgi:glycosyltransferase involved in cell wall biosynthesis